MALRARQPGWADVLEEHGIDEATCARLVSQLRSSEVAALAFCRLLERWARGDASPATAGGREAALRHAAERVETALTGLEEPLAQYLLELHEGTAEGRSWYGGPGAAELIEWGPVLLRAGVQASALRVAQSYLELAVFVRALEGLATAARFESGVERASLWAGLFDLRENLLGRGLEDLRALAA